ncbi:MAG: organic hydroperoxide resistance protein [Rickettsiales bacterium]|nr:organic hydroperoxide resistance protein [Rickettsiales bacterium]
MTKLYTAEAKSIGGRNGVSQATDGSLKFELATPGAPNAKPGTTNPEQLFACGYAACFGGALDFIAKKQGIDAKGAEVNCAVDLNKDDNGFFLSATMKVTLPGMDKVQAEKLVQATHEFCPYSKATRGNIDVTLMVNDQPLAKKAA